MKSGSARVRPSTTKTEAAQVAGDPQEPALASEGKATGLTSVRRHCRFARTAEAPRSQRQAASGWHRPWHATPKPLEQAKSAALNRACKAVYTGSIPVGAFRFGGRFAACQSGFAGNQRRSERSADSGQIRLSRWHRVARRVAPEDPNRATIRRCLRRDHRRIGIGIQRGERQTARYRARFWLSTAEYVRLKPADFGSDCGVTVARTELAYLVTFRLAVPLRSDPGSELGDLRERARLLARPARPSRFSDPKAPRR